MRASDNPVRGAAGQFHTMRRAVVMASADGPSQSVSIVLCDALGRILIKRLARRMSAQPPTAAEKRTLPEVAEVPNSAVSTVPPNFRSCAPSGTKAVVSAGLRGATASNLAISVCYGGKLCYNFVKAGGRT